MATMDDYIEQLLAEMQIPEPLQDVVQNILDEPIPDKLKRRLLQPLLPRKYRPSPPPQMSKDKKERAIQEEFDPFFPQKKIQTVSDYQKEVLELFTNKEENKDDLAFKRTPWVIGKFL